MSFIKCILVFVYLPLYFLYRFFWLGEKLVNIEKGAQGIYALNLLSLCQGISSGIDSDFSETMFR